MLNEPVGEGGDAPEVGDMGAAGEEGAPVNYIQVTPQEKEAIERVSDPVLRVSIEPFHPQWERCRVRKAHILTAVECALSLEGVCLM